MNRPYLLTAIAVSLAGAVSSLQGQVVVYDNFAKIYPVPGEPEGFWYYPVEDFKDEVADEIILAPGTPRLADTFTFEYFGAGFSGDETVRVRFYRNDGPIDADGFAMPGTMVYDSGSFQLAQPATVLARITLDLKNNNLQLPDRFTWSLTFGGINQTGQKGEAVGPVVYDPPQIGSNASYDGWSRDLKPNAAWEAFFFSNSPSNFGAQITAVPEPASTAAALLLGAVTVGIPLSRRRRRRADSEV